MIVFVGKGDRIMSSLITPNILLFAITLGIATTHFTFAREATMSTSFKGFSSQHPSVKVVNQEFVTQKTSTYF